MPALESIAPGLAERLGELAPALWRGVDSVHFGARPMFAAHRAIRRPDDPTAPLSAWLAANCLRELRGDNHWVLCAAADLDDVEVGLLHSAMVDVEEYGSEAHHEAFVARIDETAGPRWMPAVRVKPS